MFHGKGDLDRTGLAKSCLLGRRVELERTQPEMVIVYRVTPPHPDLTCIQVAYGPTAGDGWVLRVGLEI